MFKVVGVMSRYIILRLDDTIKVGDEFRGNLYDWRKQSGWAGKKVGSLISLVGDGGQMRRKTNKKIKRKACVNWR
jgi:hypothetical protein